MPHGQGFKKSILKKNILKESVLKEDVLKKAILNGNELKRRNTKGRNLKNINFIGAERDNQHGIDRRSQVCSLRFSNCGTNVNVNLQVLQSLDSLQ